MTRSELINQVLTNLGVLPVGEAPDADTSAAVDNLIDGLVAELEARDIINLKDIDTYGVEEKHLQPLARILTWRAAPAFGLQNDSGLAAMAVQGEDYLREMDRKETHWNGKHWRTMRSDYSLGRCVITNYSTL
jgi:hypothetical protein